MRTSLRLFAASLSSLLAVAFLTLVPFASPAKAITQFHTVNIGNATVVEGNAGDTLLDFSVTLSASPIIGESITASLETRDDTAYASFPGLATFSPDYVAKTGTLTWSFGDGLVKHFVVTVKGDTSKEPDETMKVVFANVTAATAGTTGTGTITNDDGGPTPTISVSIDPAQQTANEGNADNERTLVATLTNPSTQDVTVNYATVDGTATTDVSKGEPDFVKVPTAQLKWLAGATGPQDVKITIKGDALGEPNESFQVIFGGQNNAALAAGANKTVTLVNDDGAAPVFSIPAITPISEGDSGTKTLTVTVEVTAHDQPVSVHYSTADVTAVASTQDTTGDYVAIPDAVLSFGIGQNSKTFPVTINGDLSQEPDETFQVNLASANNATIGSPSTQNATIMNDDFGQITTGPGGGGGPHVRTFGASGADLGGFYAFGSTPPLFPGAVHVARGDIFTAVGAVGADGIDEIIVGTGRIDSTTSHSLPLVQVYSVSGTQLASFMAYTSDFGGGVYVAAGNFDGDPTNGDEIVTGAGPGGGPHVKIFHITAGGQNANAVDISNGGFFPYGNFPGGVRVAAANESGDAKDEVITGAGPGGSPHVMVFGLVNNVYTPTASFLAYGANFTGGVYVAAAPGKITTGVGAGGGPHVRVFDGNGTANGAGFYAYAPDWTGGVTVAMGNLDSDPAAEIVTGTGPGGGPHVRAFKQAGTGLFGNGFYAYQNFTGGVEVSIGNGG